MDIRLPSGKVIKGIPDGLSKAQIKQRAISSGAATEADFVSAAPAPAKRAEAITATQRYDEETLRGAPDIPQAEDPVKARVPFAQPPPQQVGGEGALEALGEYAPTIKKALSSEQASPSLDGQRPSESSVQAAQGGRMPFQGALAKEPRKPELISTQAIEKGREGKETKDWWEPMPDAERKVLEDRLKNYNVIRDFSPGVVAEKNKIIERLKKDDDLRSHPEKYNPNHPEYAFLANKELKQDLWPDYDVRRLAGQAPKAFPTSPDDILAGYKQSSIDPSVLEDPSIWQQLGLVPLSPQGKAAIQESLFDDSRAAGGFMSSPTGLGSIEMGSTQTPKRILSGEEKQKAKNALELDEAVRKGLPTLSLEGNPTASLVHHNRVIAKKANEFYDGDVSRYMDITESRSIIPNYLSESDQQENKILSDIRSMEGVWKTQVAAGNNDIAAETFKAITKKKDEYTKLVAQKQLDVTNEIRALSQSDDPEAKRKIEVLRAQNQLFMMTDEEREKFALKKAVPNVDELKETVFKGMSDRDILRLALHTKHLQLQEILPDNVVAKGFDAMRVTDILDEDVRRLKQEIAILAPVVFLNKTPIKKIDEGFFSTAGKSFGAGFGGEGSERTRASRLSQVLQDYGVMEGVSPEATTGMESAQAVEDWSREQGGELFGTSGEFMVKLIPTAILTEMGLGGIGIAAQVKRGADVLKLVGKVANSRKAIYAGRALRGTYEAVKQGLSYELGGSLYDQDDEMNFLSGSFGGAGGFVAGGAASKLADGVVKKILATFGNASDDVVSKMIGLGKKAAASGIRSIGQGVGETVEEFGEALGGIIDKSDSAAEIMKNLKEQFPDASSTLHFAAQSFLMGAIMGQSSTIGAALYKRAGKYYSQLNRGEKDKIDQLINEVNEVGAEVKKEVEASDTPTEGAAQGSDQVTPKGPSKLELEAQKAEIEDKRSEEIERVNLAVAEASETGAQPQLDGKEISPEQEIASINAKYDAEAAALAQPTPTADAVQVGTTAQVGAQPVGPEVTGQEGGAGVGPSVQGPTAPQAGGPQGQVAPTTEPTAEGPVRPEAPPTPKADTTKLMADVDALQQKMDQTSNKGVKTRYQNQINKLAPKMQEVMAKFDSTVADLEKSGKLKRRCP